MAGGEGKKILQPEVYAMSFRYWSPPLDEIREWEGEDYTANEGPVKIQYKCLVPIYTYIPRNETIISKTEL